MRKDAAATRAAFLRQIGPDSALYRIFDLMPEVSFFAKDLEFRLICASRSFIERLGFRDELQLTGKNDFDLFPARLAEKFRADDAEVFRTGKPKHNIVELFFNDQGIPDWYITSKEPLRDVRGKIIGLMGITHSYTGRREHLAPELQLDRALAHIRDHFRAGVTVKELAAAVHLSPRQLHRKFHETFRMSPQAFVIKLRIQAACEALQKTDAPISHVAADLGFCDQSNFAQLFQKHVGTTPLKFRQRFQLRSD
jgi:AraC-like DNA-binding protein